MGRRKKAPETAPELSENILTIRRDKDRHTIPAWRYYTIIDTLRTMGAERLAAQDEAKWAGRAPSGATREIGPIRMEVR